MAAMQSTVLMMIMMMAPMQARNSPCKQKCGKLRSLLKKLKLLNVKSLKGLLQCVQISSE